MRKQGGASVGDPAVPWIDFSGALWGPKVPPGKSAEDEGGLIALVGEVHVVKEGRTEVALDFYSTRTAWLLHGSPISQLDAEAARGCGRLPFLLPSTHHFEPGLSLHANLKKNSIKL